MKKVKSISRRKIPSRTCSIQFKFSRFPLCVPYASLIVKTIHHVINMRFVKDSIKSIPMLRGSKTKMSHQFFFYSFLFKSLLTESYNSVGIFVPRLSSRYFFDISTKANIFMRISAQFL